MLTYDIIIKHLMPELNTFSMQPNISMKSSDFPLFSSLFDETFYRYGVETNNSLNNSIKYCLNTNIDLSEFNNINDIVNKLDINIIIFDFKNNKISIEQNITSKDYINPWKPTLLLANYNNYWEPIVCKDTKVFSFSSPKAHILKNNIYSKMTDYTINDNFQEILNLEGYNVKEELSENSENYDTFIKNDTINLSVAKLNKMKKEELVELCQKLNKEIKKKSYTKKDLIDLITNN